MYDINSYDFLFKFIPEVFECNDYSALYGYIKDFAEKSNQFISEFKVYLQKAVCGLFDSKIEGSLFAVMSDWYFMLSDRTKKNVCDADTNNVMKFISTNTIYDDSYVVSNLAKSISMLAIEDWSDDTVDKFLYNIERIISNVNDFENSDSSSADQKVSIALNIDGVNYEKNLTDMEISDIAETTLSNIEEILEDYADSITAQERISVLLKLLKKEIDQM